MSSRQVPISGNLETDFVVIGGGGTGLAAAVAGAEKGARVILLEKRATLGGNAASTFGLFAADSHVQRRMSISAPKDEVFRGKARTPCALGAGMNCQKGGVV